MRPKLFLLFLTAAPLAPAATILVAGWDFNDVTGATTNNTYAASNGAQGGAALLYVDGRFGSSNLIEPSGPPSFNAGERTVSGTGSSIGAAFLGTDTRDGFTSFVTATNSNKEIQFFTNTSNAAPSGSTLNGKSVVFGFNLAGLADPMVSFAATRAAGGPSDNTWAWSTDGVNFTNAGAFAPAAGGYASYSLDLSAVNALDGAASVYLRLTFGGQTSGAATSNSLFLDNFQINASTAAVPEPSTYALMGLGLAALALVRRRR